MGCLRRRSWAMASRTRCTLASVAARQPGRRRAAAGADPAGAGWSRPNALWQAGLRQALRQALPAPVVATPAGAALPAPGATTEPLTPAQAHAAIAASQDVFLASCTDFNGSPFARSPGNPCPAAVWGCLQCPNAVFTERHLPSLAGFAAFLETQREELPAADWQAR